MPTHHLFATVWKIKAMSEQGIGLVAKKQKIQAALATANEYMHTAKDRMIPRIENPVYLFAAPEYYWLKGRNLAHFDEDEKDDIFEFLRLQSVRYPDLVIVPGSVQWKVAKGDYVGTSAKPQQLSKEENQFVAFNTTPVFLNGERVLTYFKKFNDGFVEGQFNSQVKAAYGGGPAEAGQVFTANGLEFGLEVCGDFNEGKLNTSLQGRTIDVMVMIAGSMGHDFSGGIAKVPVRNGGAFVHCDTSGKADRNGLWVISRNGGWHGSQVGVSYFTFQDMSGVTRIVGIALGMQGQVNVKTMRGFGATRSLPATVERQGQRITKFTIAFSSGNRKQTAQFYEDGGPWKVKLSRKFSSSQTKTATRTSDTTGMVATGEGNVSKIGALVPHPGLNADLRCYYTPILPVT